MCILLSFPLCSGPLINTSHRAISDISTIDTSFFKIVNIFFNGHHYVFAFIIYFYVSDKGKLMLEVRIPLEYLFKELHFLHKNKVHRM